MSAERVGTRPDAAARTPWWRLGARARDGREDARRDGARRDEAARPASAPRHGDRSRWVEETEPARARRTVGVPPELLRQVRLIELRTRGLVNAVFAGEYHSVFKGQGMEFAEVREYQPGDEVRSIDWNVTARMRRPFVKRYVEERELTVMLAVDLSGSERFGTARRFKSELATELGAVLAMSAVRNNDRVGILLFTDRVEHVVPPSKGRRHALRMIRDLLVHEPAGTGTDIAGALEYLRRMLKQKTIIFLVSDFLANDLERPLKLLAQRHDVVACTIEDPSEHALPDVGFARLRDPETGETIFVNTSDPAVRSKFEQSTLEEREARQRLLRRLAIDEIAVRTDAGIIEPLLRFFRSRETRDRWR